MLGDKEIWEMTTQPILPHLWTLGFICGTKQKTFENVWILWSENGWCSLENYPVRWGLNVIQCRGMWHHFAAGESWSEAANVWLCREGWGLIKRCHVTSHGLTLWSTRFGPNGPVHQHQATRWCSETGEENRKEGEKSRARKKNKRRWFEVRKCKVQN